MAGHEKGGATYASAWMFRGARWIITPVKATSPASVRVVEGLVKAMGATPVRIDAEGHDRHVATVSHLPHVLAALLVNMGESLESVGAAGGSWRDMTRVGGVDPDLWTQIFMRNRTELAHCLRDYEAGLSGLREALERDDREAVHVVLHRAEGVKKALAAEPSEAREPQGRTTVRLEVSAAAGFDGELRPPSDKSLTHRAYMFAALARGESVVRRPLQGEDCESTLACLNALGLDFTREGIRFA